MTALDTKPSEGTRTIMNTKLYRNASEAPLWVRTVLLALIFTALSALVGYRYILEHSAISPQDEYVYIDAVDKAMHGEVTRQYSETDEYARSLVTCVGIEIYGPQGPACGDTSAPSEDYPFKGYSTASVHSPLYFFITAFLTKILLFLAPGKQMYLLAKFTGTLWLGLGLTATWRLARYLGGSRLITASVTALMLASPAIRWANFYITPDSFSLLAGSFIFLSALKMVRKEWTSIPLIVASVFFGLIKFQMLFATGAALLFILIYFIRIKEERSSLKRPILLAFLALLLGLVAQFAYQYYRNVTAIHIAKDYSIDAHVPFSPTFAVEQLDNFLTYLYMGPVSLNGGLLGTVGLPYAFTTLSSLLLVSGLVGAALFAVHTEVLHQSFALALLLASIFVAPAFYIYLNLTMGVGFDLAPRYGAALLPALAIGLPVTVKSKTSSVLVAVFAVFALAFALIANSIV